MTPEEQKQKKEMSDALLRADRLIQWMSGYIGNMAPGNYADCYVDLNTHGIYMDRWRKL